MRLISLQSGSNGNSLYVESGGKRLLFDAGISGKQAEDRLKSFDIDIRDVDGLIISHDHSDHIGAAGIYHRKYDIPLFVTHPTLARATQHKDLGKLSNISYFKSGDTLSFGTICVETHPTPHDGIDGVAFIVSNHRKRLGILTDLGHVNERLDHIVGTLDALFIESNYDIKMLDMGAYPMRLKRRIKGPGGHLSNLETARLIRSHAHHLEWAVLGHLSENNNTPKRALDTCLELLRIPMSVHMASRYCASGGFEL